ncbi:hypothetical protein FXO38_25418 [Capsicum annuum]|nr:hypothetical protein FXO38_25418 [Capsicum annuum]
MNVKGNIKDTIKTQLDLQAMNIRPKLYPIQRENEVEVSTACYILSPEEKHKLCIFLKNLKVLNGFSSNISQCVNLKEHKISGLKIHNCDVILQHILPLALHGAIEKGPEEGLTNSTMCSSQVMGTTLCKNFMVWENECMPVNTSLTLSTNEVKPYTQEIETTGTPCFAHFDASNLPDITTSTNSDISNLYIKWDMIFYPNKLSTSHYKIIAGYASHPKLIQMDICFGRFYWERAWSTMCSSQVMGMTIHKNSMVCENEHMQVDTPFSPSTNQVKQFTKEVEASVIGKGPEGLENFTVSSSQGMGRILKNSMGQENEHMQVHTSFSPLTNQVKQCTKEVETSNNPLILEKENMQSNSSLPPSTDQVMKSSQTVEIGMDKFESDNMNDHHDHIFEWMNSRVTNGEDTCIGGKDGNSPYLGTIFYETHEKGNKFVELEEIEKHVRLQRPPKLPPLPLPHRCSIGKPPTPKVIGDQRPATNRHPHRLEPTVVQVLYYEQQHLRDVMDESQLVATESPALVLSKMNHQFSTDIRPISDEVSSLKQENQELKFELLKMKTKLKEIEKTNSNRLATSSPSVITRPSAGLISLFTDHVVSNLELYSHRFARNAWFSSCL